MNEKHKISLQKFFSVSTVVFGIIYLIFMTLALLSPVLPVQLIVSLIFGSFFLFIIQDTVNEKAEEAGNLKQWRILSLPFFTILILICYAAVIYLLQPERQTGILWAVIALYDSILLDKSMRALHNLKDM